MNALINHIALVGFGFVLGVATLFFVAWRYWSDPEPEQKIVVLQANHQKELLLQLKRSTNRLQEQYQRSRQFGKTHLLKLINDNRKLIAKCKQK